MKSAPASLQELFTEDAQQTAACFERWPHEYTQLSRGRYCGRVQRLTLTNLEIVREQVNRAVEQRGTCPPGTYSFSMFTVPDCHAKDSHAEFHFGDAQLHNNHYERRLISDADADAITITIEGTWLEALAQPSRLAPTVCCSGAAVSRVLTLALDAIAVAAASPELLYRQAWGEAVADAIGEAICDAFASIDALGRALRARSNAAALVEKARCAILSDESDLKTIGWVCERLGVSRSRLQYSFAAEVGMEPAEYLRTHRLNRCRRDLLSATARTTVLDVAIRWGFWHPGRFARYYRDMFGESPSCTLKRAGDARHMMGYSSQ